MLETLCLDFTRETGISVELVQEPWGSWQTLFFNEMSRKGRTFDMVVGDSQWLGRGAVQGHYTELTKWVQSHGLDRSMTRSSIEGYAEFPKGSGHLWAVPLEGDAMGFSFRKDLFEDPEEKKAFHAKYGYELRIPKTWQSVKDIAQFFYRPKKDLYGLLSWVEPHYDGLTMGVQTLIWAFGGDLGDRRTYRVRDIINSREAIEALKFYKSLNRFNNPQWQDHYLDTHKNSNTPMMKGRVAMAMGYFSINSELLDPGKTPYAGKIGFFAAPSGPGGRACTLGGQGVSIISYSRKKDLSLRFLEWFIREDVQKKWASLGGLTCNKNVLNSDEFLNASPINKPFKESIEMAKDFWAVPEYADLLRVSQTHWFEYVVIGSRSPESAMDRIATEWEQIFESGGYYKE